MLAWCSPKSNKAELLVHLMFFSCLETSDTHLLPSFPTPLFRLQTPLRNEYWIDTVYKGGDGIGGWQVGGIRVTRMSTAEDVPSFRAYLPLASWVKGDFPTPIPFFSILLPSRILSFPFQLCSPPSNSCLSAIHFENFWRTPSLYDIMPFEGVSSKQLQLICYINRIWCCYITQ